MNGDTCTIANGEEFEFSKNVSGYAKVEQVLDFHTNAPPKAGAKVQLDECGVTVSSLLERKPENFDLFNKRLFGVRLIASDRYHDELSIVKKNIIGHQYEDVGVLKKHDIHDLHCSTCDFYRTKRVILPRKAISPDIEEVISLPTENCKFKNHERYVRRKDLVLERTENCSKTISVIYRLNLYNSACECLLGSHCRSQARIKEEGCGEVSVPIPEVTGPLSDLQEPLLGHEREASRVDVIKAIVYGGLLESIASLSIIVSAAGGDATTLNIVALGLANVFGGLLVLGNNLMTLKELTAQQYEVQLGQPKHIIIHATIAVISYLFFGLISPLIYGFSFYKSDDKYFKLATVAASSLVCITVLSTGKAYVQRPPKSYFQTMFYHISLAVTASGIAYIAGHLISILLMKVRVFE